MKTKIEITTIKTIHENISFAVIENEMLWGDVGETEYPLSLILFKYFLCKMVRPEMTIEISKLTRILMLGSSPIHTKRVDFTPDWLKEMGD